MEMYWTFYLTKHGRRELLNRSRSFDAAKADSTPAGSLVLANIGDPVVDALVASGRLKRVNTIVDEERQAVLHDPAAVNYARRPTVSMSLVNPGPPAAT